MSELFAASQRASTPFTGACRLPRSSVTLSPEFKGVVKWRLSQVFVSCRISDVKAECRLTLRRCRFIKGRKIKGGMPRKTKPDQKYYRLKAIDSNPTESRLAAEAA